MTRTRFDGCTILRGDFDKILRRLSRQGLTFDLIFSDAPYGKGLAQQSLTLVAELNLISAGGLTVIEHGADEILIAPPTLRLIRNATYGKTTAIEIFVKEQTA